MIAVSLVVALEHIVIGLKIVLTICIADMPPWVQKAVRLLVQ